MLSTTTSLRDAHAHHTLYSEHTHNSGPAPRNPRDKSKIIKIVEVAPRDGLQNEKTPLTPAVKAELVDRLARTGLDVVESGSFVSPKWVPQMGGTPDVLLAINPLPHVKYPVLVPNAHGLTAFLSLLSSHPHLRSSFTEIAIFTAASDAFNQRNTNCTIAESLARLAPVVKQAREEGLSVRGYVSMVVECPFEGKIAPAKVREVSERLMEMGCYEVSLGDTVGRGTPETVGRMLEEVKKGVDVGMLAGHFHDTFGMGIANCWTALEAGVRTLDASVAGLGGCPYSPGATGNVATEDVLYMLRDSAYSTFNRVEDNLIVSPQHDTQNGESQTGGGGNGKKENLIEIGEWISGLLGRETQSRVARATKSSRTKSKL